MIKELFKPNEVALFEGDAEVSKALLSLPFNHIFFTGSPRVGKIVMGAAAKNLTSVTLELGGKSPTIVDKTANVFTAGEKIAWGKLVNNGQTCIAPDYVLVEKSVKEKLVVALEKATNKMFNPSGKGIEQSPDYDRIVNLQHFHRLKYLLEDAVEKGAKIEFGGQLNEKMRFVAPTVISNVTDEMDIMHEEIFGPILPILTYENKEEVLHIIRQRPKPLSLYIFTQSSKTKEYFLSKTTAGTTVVNDCLIQFAHNNLPFGGVNNSGIGKSGGEFGFKEFSNARAVVEQKIGTAKPLYPPYTDSVKKMTDLLLKWL
jgi:aldehyde dehydrogenase (NAD+)